MKVETCTLPTQAITEFGELDVNGIITTVAGSGGPMGGFSGDGEPATAAQLNSPVGIAIDNAENLYVSDASNDRIRKVDSAGFITTIAGSGSRSNCFSQECYSGDDGRAVAAQLSRSVQGLAVDNAGAVYIADSGNNWLRKVTFNVPPSQLLPPTIQSTAGIGVLNGASFRREIASGTWVTIFGQHLAPLLPPGRIWRDSEIVDGRLPP
jgi:hypothetical protein